MKKSKLLTPILTIGSLGAVVTPMSILTSCNKSVNTGKDANLVQDYVCGVSPAAKKTYDTANDALSAYLTAVEGQTNDNDYTILKDDARYSYSLGLKSDNFTEWVGGSYTSYTLDFDNIKIVNTDTTKTMNVTFVIKVKGAFSDGTVTVEDADLSCTFRMNDPFKLAFYKPDGRIFENLNYITCTPQGVEAKYTITGSAKIDSVECTFDNDSGTCDISKYEPSTSQEKIAYAVKQFVLTGLTCNFKDPSSVASEGGVLYSNYMSLAEIK